MRAELAWREEDGERLGALVWRTGERRFISSALVGGGIGNARWVLNAQVAAAYSRMDPAGHVRELAGAHGLRGPGVGMLTAASVARVTRAEDEGAEVFATVGLRVMTWAAAPPGRPDPELARGAQVDEALVPRVPPPYVPGTVNILVSVPVALGDAALVNAVATATEAKTQALLETGFAGTGTATDCVCVAAMPYGPAEPFAGPRSLWGARIARAVHAAVGAGARDYAALLRSALPGPVTARPA
ncbi:adenosylcobinamide amidohydrolase [Bailinhaonella thermotolerans]|uniref:Adenosylcobinamide amidohydrolase n=1 Tax=Bailinhaonella thermotolerans TaxID=1070861 RepID=A0A3A4AW12_9ACTN|nr:adenosylcobinamide amidohydrolase [Bailinhaonella thermotolerans]RJL34065.1 adenosylcobinamide amidohydrolase [Bailinhaonella thermotolerans]